jgi:hypothetical protein
VTGIRALTIMEPWCSAIAFGGKRVENRSWPTAWRGPLALHAGRSVDWEAPDMAWRAASLTFLRDAPPREWRAKACLGAVIAVADLTGCHPRYHVCNPGGPVTVCSPWAAWGQCHWLLGNVRPLPEPVPCKGALGLWRLPEDAEKAVRAQLEAPGA